MPGDEVRVRERMELLEQHLDRSGNPSSYPPSTWLPRNSTFDMTDSLYVDSIVSPTVLLLRTSAQKTKRTKRLFTADKRSVFKVLRRAALYLSSAFTIVSNRCLLT
jgi:hypothetical protein